MALRSTPKAICRGLTLGGFLLTLLAGAHPARPDDPATPVLTVHIYNVGSAGTRDIHQLELSATRIFNQAAIQMLWVDCSNACVECATLTRLTGRSARNIVQLRVVDQLDRGGEHALGWTNPNSTEFTVGYNRARLMARASTFGLSPGQILGHVAAHEIGHILLGTTTHSPFGVMKSAYYGSDLLNMAKGNLLFNVQESKTLRAMLGSVSAGDATKDVSLHHQMTCTWK